MIRAAICDDNPEELDILCRTIDAYNIENSGFNNIISYDCFSSGAELLSRITSGVFYDCVFLDVIMPVLSGIDVAREIYETGNATRIIFLTSSKEFAIDSYSVEALDYILKPITHQGFSNAVNKFLKYHRQSETDEIIIRDKSNMIRITLHTLRYIEVFDHYLFYHISTGESIKCRQKLSEVENILAGNNKFVKAHRSYIVNIDYIQKIEPGQLIMTTGEIIPVSKSNYRLITDSFLKSEFEKGVL